MNEHERQVKAVHSMACCTSRVKYRRDGGREHVFEIIADPFDRKANKPISSACLTPAAAWASAASRLAKKTDSTPPHQREREL